MAWWRWWWWRCCVRVPFSSDALLKSANSSRWVEQEMNWKEKRSIGVDKPFLLSRCCCCCCGGCSPISYAQNWQADCNSCYYAIGVCVCVCVCVWCALCGGHGVCAMMVCAGKIKLKCRMMIMTCKFAYLEPESITMWIDLLSACARDFDERRQRRKKRKFFFSLFRSTCVSPRKMPTNIARCGERRRRRRWRRRRRHDQLITRRDVITNNKRFAYDKSSVTLFDSHFASIV